MKGTILHIAPTPFFADRGCHIRIEGIVRCLDRLQYDNLVCTYHHGRDVNSVNTRRIKPIKNYTQTAAGPSKYKLLADWRLLWLALREYRRLNPSVIHAHLHEGLLIGVLLKIMMFWRRTPLLADMQGSLTGELDAYGKFEGRPALKSLTRTFERILLWFPNHIVCSSSHSLGKLRDEFGVPKHKSSLAQDGADEFQFLDDSETARIRRELELPADKTIAVYSGALLDSKGLTELKELIKLSDEGRIHFLIIGYPTEDLSEFLARENLSDRCTLTGQVDFDRLPQLLSACDIAIDPKNSSAGEGSGKMLNYLACGLPIVAFDTTNNQEFSPPGTPLAANLDELSGLLRVLSIDEAKRRAASRTSLAHFKQHYSWSRTEEQLRAVYCNLL
jgi:glycosyltransferase involved in cell wall biosynthesis